MDKYILKFGQIHKWNNVLRNKKLKEISDQNKKFEDKLKIITLAYTQLKKTYRKKQWLIKVADRVQARSTKYQKQYWGCEKDLKRKKFIFF